MGKEVVKCEMDKNVYFSIPSQIRDMIHIKEVFEPDVDYSSNEIWIELKKQSNKAYKKLKETEYNIRHGKL